MEIGNGTFLQGDCLELMRGLPDGSVDMVLCDLPYGTTAIAAENAGRKWICMERDPTYYESAVGRVWDHVNAA